MITKIAITYEQLLDLHERRVKPLQVTHLAPDVPMHYSTSTSKQLAKNRVTKAVDHLKGVAADRFKSSSGIKNPGYFTKGEHRVRRLADRTTRMEEAILSRIRSSQQQGKHETARNLAARLDSVKKRREAASQYLSELSDANAYGKKGLKEISDVFGSRKGLIGASKEKNNLEMLSNTINTVGSVNYRPRKRSTLRSLLDKVTDIHEMNEVDMAPKVFKGRGLSTRFRNKNTMYFSHISPEVLLRDHNIATTFQGPHPIYKKEILRNNVALRGMTGEYKSLQKAMGRMSTPYKGPRLNRRARDFVSNKMLDAMEAPLGPQPAPSVLNRRWGLQGRKIPGALPTSAPKSATPILSKWMKGLKR